MTGRTILVLCVLAGCASYKRPESIESKMGRFESKSRPPLPVPKIHIPLPGEKQQGNPPSKKTDSRGLTNHSNKHLYVLTLYEQYRQFSRYTSNPEDFPDISLCPGFHSVLLEHKEKAPPLGPRRSLRLTLERERLRDRHYTALHPELYLPLGESTVLHILQQSAEIEDSEKLLQEAIGIHTENIRQELEELCEHGHSDHYWAFANLVTEGKTRNPKTLLKTTLFTNAFLLTSLKTSSKKEGRFLASEGPADDDGVEAFHSNLVERFHAPWVQDSLESLRKK